MKQHHRVLFGEDVLQGLEIPLQLHRVQVEYELREKLILLRQQLLLLSDNKKGLWNLLVRSVPSFVTLFRHALIALGEAPPATGKREAVQTLAKKIGFDPSAILQVLDVRERKLDSGKVDVNELFSRYLATVQEVTAAVDQAMGQDATGRP
jgi:hypothetical protein